jgi:hypothetical protein
MCQPGWRVGGGGCAYLPQAACSDDFDPEDGYDIFLRNVGSHTDYTALDVSSELSGYVTTTTICCLVRLVIRNKDGRFMRRFPEDVSISSNCIVEPSAEMNIE